MEEQLTALSLQSVPVDSNVSFVPEIDPNASLIMPSPPIVRADKITEGKPSETDWPLLSIQLDFFETAIAQRRNAALKSNNKNDEQDNKIIGASVASASLLLDTEDVPEGAWGKDANLELDGKFIMFFVVILLGSLIFLYSKLHQINSFLFIDLSCNQDKKCSGSYSTYIVQYIELFYVYRFS